MKRRFALLAIVIAVAAIYAPAVRNGFVWDDTALILRDPLIRSWQLIPEGFNHFLFVDATASNFYRPIQRLTYTIEYGLFMVRPAPYHLTNIALHAGAAMALLFFAETLFLSFAIPPRRSLCLASIASFIWAIHPVHSAAVDYVSGRADPLAAVFGFLGCYLALVSLRAEKRRRLFILAGAGLAFFASALSKESGLMFPVLSLVLLLALKNYRAALQLGVAAIFVAALYLSLRLAADHTVPPHFGTEPPLAARPITAARAIAEYTGLLLFPTNLHMDRSVQNSFGSPADMSKAAWREMQTLAGISLLGCAIIAAIHARKRNPVVFVSLFLTAVSYLPMSGLFPLNSSVAEHWIYIPSAFLFLAATAAVSQLLEALPLRPRSVRALGAVVVCWVAFLGLRTFVRGFDWRDQRTFLERTIAAGGDSARMLINLGALESGENQLGSARRHLESALRKEPDQPFAVINLAAVAVKENDFAAARQLLDRARQMPLVEAQAHELLAILESKENGRANLLRLRLAAHTGAPNWLIEKRYIRVLAETGAMAAAIHEAKTCLQNDWFRAETWQLLAQLLLKSGHKQEAAEALACANSYDVHLASRPLPL